MGSKTVINLSESVIALPLREARRIFEKEYFSQVISKHYTITSAAKTVGMERSALSRKIKHLGLNIKYDD